jgi:tetratricopeptide (TPR) repeat protein
MAKIFFSISKIWLLAYLIVSSEGYSSEKVKLTRDLKNKSYEYFKKEEYSKALPFIQRYLEIQPYEIDMKLLYAQTLLYREDLPIPSRDEDNYSRAQKWKLIRSNYKESSAIFEENVLKVEQIRPRDPNLGKWYFQWATAEWFSGNKEKAINLFQKAVKKDFTLTDSYYNMGAIYESMGQFADADFAWRKYIQAEKDLNPED